jgi:hypothetical protein
MESKATVPTTNNAIDNPFIHGTLPNKYNVLP